VGQPERGGAPGPAGGHAEQPTHATHHPPAGPPARATRANLATPLPDKRADQVMSSTIRRVRTMLAMVSGPTVPSGSLNHFFGTCISVSGSTQPTTPSPSVIRTAGARPGGSLVLTR